MNSDENIGNVKTIIQETPTKSVRFNVFKELDSNRRFSSHNRILKFIPYKTVMQYLKDTDVSSRSKFGKLDVEKHLFNIIWFSDGAYFTLDGHINRHDMRIWETSKPDFYEERPLYWQKVTVWTA